MSSTAGSCSSPAHPAASGRSPPSRSAARRRASSPTTVGTAKAPRGPSPAIPDERRLLVQADLARPGIGPRALRRGARLAGSHRRRRRQRRDAAGDAVRRQRRGVGRELGGRRCASTCSSRSSLMREAVRHFLDIGGGTIVALSSWAARAGLGDRAALGLRGVEGRGPERRADDRPQPRPGRDARLRRRAGHRPDADVRDLGRRARRGRRRQRRPRAWARWCLPRRSPS